MFAHLEPLIAGLSLLEAPIFLFAVMAASGCYLYYRNLPFHGVVTRGYEAGKGDAILDGIALFVCYGFFAALVCYLIYPNYIDQDEPLMAATAWLIPKGFAIQPPLTEGRLTGLLYGPAHYQLMSVILSFIPTVEASKVLGIAMTLAGIGFQCATIGRISQDLRTRKRLKVIAIVLAANSYYLFTNKPDPFIYALVSSSIYALLACKARNAALLIGLAAGLALNMKAHAFLYFAPLAALLIAETSGRSARMRLAVIAAASAAFAAFLPFILPGGNVFYFVDYLFLATHHGIDPDLLTQNVALSGVFLALPAAVYGLSRARPSFADKIFLIAFAVSISLVSVVASKAGTGPHHLLPFIPVTVFALARALRTAACEHGEVRSTRVLRLLYVPLLATFGLVSLDMDVQFTRTWLGTYDRETAKLTDLEGLFVRHPDAEMGVSINARYHDTYLSAAMVLRGGNLLFSPPAWVDLQASGVDDDYTLGLIADCRVGEWIVPNEGKPFSMVEPPLGAPLLSQRFQDLFERNYSLVEQGQFYSVWQCSRPGFRDRVVPAKS